MNEPQNTQMNRTWVKPGQMMARPVALAAVLFALLTAQGCFFSQAEEEGNKTFDVQPKTRLIVHNANGSIKVESGVPGRIEVHWTKKAKAFSNAKKLLGKIHVTTTLTGTTLHVNVDQPSGSGTKNYGVSFRIQVPTNTPVDIENHNGTIHVDSVAAPMSVKTSNGSVYLSGVKGAADAKSSNGTIKIDGQLTSFAARTSNGSVTVRLESGSRLDQDSSIRTSNGSIKFYAASDVAFAVQADTHNGHVKSDFPLAHTSRKSASGTVGQGGKTVRLKTSNGSITLSKL
ncbi:MAG: DUF4097 family beta strand repeat protein [Deltaproteobacteria bacterium]|nr:DUF4097 family beta strand repeat protein [Deltaproteobacteria bacterium]